MDRICATQGFEIVNDIKVEFQSVEVYLKWLWSTTHGKFDLTASHRLRKFNGLEIVENVNTRLIAVKRKKRTDVRNEVAE